MCVIRHTPSEQHIHSNAAGYFGNNRSYSSQSFLWCQTRLTSAQQAITIQGGRNVLHVQWRSGVLSGAFPHAPQSARRSRTFTTMDAVNNGGQIQTWRPINSKEGCIFSEMRFISNANAHTINSSNLNGALHHLFGIPILLTVHECILSAKWKCEKFSMLHLKVYIVIIQKQVLNVCDCQKLFFKINTAFCFLYVKVSLGATAQHCSWRLVHNLKKECGDKKEWMQNIKEWGKKIRKMNKSLVNKAECKWWEQNVIHLQTEQSKKGHHCCTVNQLTGWTEQKG